MTAFNNQQQQYRRFPSILGVEYGVGNWPLTGSMSLVGIRKSGSSRIRPSTRLTALLVWIRGLILLETKTGFRSDWVFKRQDSNFGGNVYIQLYTVGHCSQSSDGQWNLSSDANRSISIRRRSLDGVDSSDDKTTITTIPTVGVYSYIVATRRQSLLSRPSKTISWELVLCKYVLRSESTSLEQIYDLGYSI